ncbi:hypothetical protein ACFLR7_02925 [Acidobacteriota bacterium]
MNIKFYRFFSLLLVVSLAAFACGGGEGNAASEKSVQKKTSPPDQKANMTPEEIGVQVGDLYEQAMSELVGALEERPAVADVKEQIESMREEYIQKLVALGKLREELTAAEKSKTDLQVHLKFNELNKTPMYASFNEIQMHYFSDRSFHKTIMSFNILTQYASFELLKKQDPDEAARLGIQ